MGNVLAVKSRESVEHMIICGDFNQNPYDSGVVAGGCFNATSDRMIAKKMKRIIQGKPYLYFYNPMWKFYGSSERPFGTYFYKSSDHIVVNWNILDQFLISSSLLDSVSDNDFRIITKTKKHNFLRKNGNIDFRNYSDHLPILMSSNL
jgi:exonuclease III